MSNNSSLLRAKEAKKDEFYTQLTDIEKELQHYRAHFQDKVVFCNCDDPEYSNFWRYFSSRFRLWGLKKLIATHYEYDKPSYMLSMERQGGETPTVIRSLKGNGDFRSEECIELLKEADIVVTNPPFSLFREYVAQLIQYDKKFVIIGNQNFITYKEIFPLLKNSEIWLGFGCNLSLRFKMPDYYEVNGKTSYVNEKGEKIGTVPGITWFTNIDIKKRHEPLSLYKLYTPEEFPKYDNYEAVNVNRVADIPRDYFGVMGVPITFLEKFNPNEFDILGASEQCGTGLSNGLWNKGCKVKHPLINNKKTYSRLFIRKKGACQNEN